MDGWVLSLRTFCKKTVIANTKYIFNNIKSRLSRVQSILCEEIPRIPFNNGAWLTTFPGNDISFPVSSQVVKPAFLAYVSGDFILERLRITFTSSEVNANLYHVNKFPLLLAVYCSLFQALKVFSQKKGKQNRKSCLERPTVSTIYILAVTLYLAFIAWY